MHHVYVRADRYPETGKGGPVATWDDPGMPRSSNDGVPRDYAVAGIWPHAVLADDAPVSAHYGQALGRNLERALASTNFSLRTLAESTGVTHSTISRVINGRVLPDLGTLARLEAAVGFQLWPGLAALPSAPQEE